MNEYFKDTSYPVMFYLRSIRKASFGILCLFFVIMLTMRAENHKVQIWDQLEPFVLDRNEEVPFKRIYRIPITMPTFDVKELIPSWNLEAKEGDLLKINIQATFPDGSVQSYTLGQWTTGQQELNGSLKTRSSFNGQKNDYGAVYTDTLVFKKKPVSCTCFIELHYPLSRTLPQLKLVSVCMTGKPDSVDKMDKLTGPKPPIELDVPRRCQLDYIGGRVWCSPTSVTMILAYWAKILNRSDLEYSVPIVANRIFDPAWPGTGNWPFNTAFAGEHTGLHAYVSRLESVDALYDLVARGIPVATSVSYDLLKGKPEKGKNDGHLVVCIGFDEEGNPIFNDPARCPEIRISYPMEHFSKAWQSSKRTVYLIKPPDDALPSQTNRLF